MIPGRQAVAPLPEKSQEAILTVTLQRFDGNLTSEAGKQFGVFQQDKGVKGIILESYPMGIMNEQPNKSPSQFRGHDSLSMVGPEQELIIVKAEFFHGSPAILKKTAQIQRA